MSGLLGYSSCCESVGTAPPTDDECHCTAANVGVGIEHYITGSTGPFEFRRTTGTGDVDCRIDGGDPNTNQVHHTANLATRSAFQTLIANPSRDVLTPGDLRLFLIGIEAGTNISFDNITADSFRINSPDPPPAASWKAFQVDSTATLLTDSSSFVTFVTLAGDAKVLNGSVWKINMCVLVCVPDSVFVNAEQQWQIETSAGVFTTFDQYSTFQEITIAPGEFSTPYHRTKKLTATMDAPRMRLRVRRHDPGFTDFYWELPRWGGVMITEAE